MAATLGTVQPFRYRRYVFDEEMGLYYLRSRYYCSTACRFISEDELIKGNLYTYAMCNPISLIDESGRDTKVYFDEWYPNWSYVMNGNDPGDHSADELIPPQYMLSAILQMYYEEWTYSKTLTYKAVDCNGMFRMICKTFYSGNAYNKILGDATTVETVLERLGLKNKLEIIDSKESVPAFYFVISKDFSHMGITIGTYGDNYNVAESAKRFNGLHISSDWTIGTGTRDFYYYCPIPILDYSQLPLELFQAFLTVEDDD